MSETADQFRWGEATDEPALARQSIATTAREDHRKAGQAAGPIKMSNWHAIIWNGQTL